MSTMHALRQWIMTLTSGMGTSSPAEVLHNFIRIVEGASPRVHLAIALATPWAMLAAALSSYAKVWSALHTATRYIVDTVAASVRIPGSHPLQKQVLAYVVDQGLGKHARTLALSPAARDPKQLMMSYMSVYDNIYGRGARQQQQRHAEPEENEKPALAYVPQVGSYAFWWKGNRITLRQESREYEERDSRGKYHFVQATVADIELSCISIFGGAGPIRDFLKFVQNIPTKERTTTIYRPQSAAWDAGVVQSSSNLNAVTMNSSIKDALVKDVETYLAPQTKKFYANRGIPYGRGYLFYGPPGTGKTSFAKAIAGHFNLNVYMISLSTKTLTDNILESLFEQLPNKCIVLLEDIDSAGIQRENMRRKTKKASKKQKREMLNQYGEPVYVEPPGITLSGLLNVLDGIHSREGMITIMTSNTPDSLDQALVRPGRCDQKILFSYASKEVNAKLFRHIFEKTEEERVEGEMASNIHDVAALSEQFADIIPADKLTPADVQGFLLIHRADPTKAVEEAEEWSRKTLEIKAKGTNVAAFEGALAAKTEQEALASTGEQAEAARNDSAHEDDAGSEETGSSTDQLAGAAPPTQSLHTRYQPAFSPYSTGNKHYYAGYAPSSYSRRPSEPPLAGLPSTTGRMDSFVRQVLSSTEGPARFDMSLTGTEPTPPYSRSNSRSPSSTEDDSAKEEQDGEKAEAGAGGEEAGTKKGDD